MKLFIRKEADRYRIYNLKRGPRQLVSISQRLYSVDDNLFYRDPQTSEAYVMYDIDSLQPYGHEPEYLNTEMLRVQILSSNISGTKKSMVWKLDGSKIDKYLTAIIMVGAFLYVLLKGGLF